MPKLKLQYFGYLMGRADPDAGRDWGQKEEGMTEDEMADSMDMSVSKLQELVIDREAMECYSSWGCR